MPDTGEPIVLTLHEVAMTLEHAGLTLGLLLAAALLGGMVAERVHLPKVTAYLVVGLLLGPYTLESLPQAVFSVIPRQFFAITTIPKTHLTFLDPMANLAMALVLFNMGCSFALRSIRSHWPSILRLSAGEIGVTFVLVSVGLMCLGESWSAAILFGALALATAPATTVLVLKESQSEGPITQYANTLVALNNVVAILVFEVLLVAIMAIQGKSDSPVLTSVARLSLDVFGSISAGMLAGLAVTLGCAFLSRSRWLVLLFAVSTAMLGICQRFELPYLLTFLIMGATVANTSSRVKDIVAQLDQVTGLLCVVFFVLHGTEMDVRALLTAGIIGIGYMALRTVGKYFGIFFAARRQEGEGVKHWLGATLLSQAGAAIALSAIAANRYPEIGIHLRDIILGTVIVFEIGGPILIRQAVIRTGSSPRSGDFPSRDNTIGRVEFDGQPPHDGVRAGTLEESRTQVPDNRRHHAPRRTRDSCLSNVSTRD
jgi:Kef-type K+ transport system membrane component KefB